MLNCRRGVSEVLGAVLIAIIVMSMSAAYVMLEAGRSSRETMSIVDLIRAAEKRQKQLLSLTYYHKQGGNLKLYIYNYGEEASTPKMILAGQEMIFYRTVWIFEWYEIAHSTGRFGGKLGESTYAGESYTFNWRGGTVFGGRSDRIGYSAKTTMYFKGSSTITIRTDDGMEVYVDGQPVFGGAAWHLQPPTTYRKTVSLQQGTHEVTVKWYEWYGGAYSSFSTTNIALHSSLSMKNMNTGQPCEDIPPKTLVELTLPAPSMETFNLVLFTEEGGFYSWRIAF